MYPAPYARLKAQCVELIAVPSYVAHDDAWENHGKAMMGTAPDGVDRRDVGRSTEGQAWRRYALTERLDSTGARAGINVFLCGSLWDLGADGRSVMILPGRAPVEAPDCGAALLNLWL